MSDRPRPETEHHRPSSSTIPTRRAAIEKNGREYIVSIKGAVFLALSLAEAEAIARRANGLRRSTR